MAFGEPPGLPSEARTTLAFMPVLSEGRAFVVAAVATDPSWTEIGGFAVLVAQLVVLGTAAIFGTGRR